MSGDERLLAPLVLGTGLVLILMLTVGADRLEISPILPGAALVVGVYFLVNERIEVSLVLLGLYLGLLDGYLKLSTGSDQVAAVRDLLILLVIAGIVLRACVKRSRLEDVPPYVRLFGALVLLVLVQGLHPETPGLPGLVGGIRQHLGFVPLFFFGFYCMRSEARLRLFAVLLLAVAGINAVVALVQYNMTPEELADWGPGYRDLLLGENEFEGGARTFVDDSGEARVRPMALGSDLGASSVFGFLALGSAFALLQLRRAPRERAVAVVGLLLAGVGVFAGQARSGLVCAVLTVLLVVALNVRRQADVRLLSTVIVGVLLVYGSITLYSAGGGSAGGFDRFATLGPQDLSTTVAEDRGESLELLDDLIAQYPAGVGLARSGPASGFAGNPVGLDTENQLNFLLLELGLPGIAIFYALLLLFLRDAIRAVRSAKDPQRLLLAGLAAPLFAVVILGFGAVISTSSPVTPYLFFVAGVMAYYARTSASTSSTKA